jgi:hypothetical protein
MASGSRGRLTTLGVIEIEVFGIRALKVGVASKGLRHRYREALKAVHLEARIDELDALLIENKVHRAFSDEIDRRIMLAGMRAGKRWPGDTECYWYRSKERILDKIKAELTARKVGSVDYAHEAAEFERVDLNFRAVRFERDTRNQKRAVICLDTGERFPSVGAAAKAKGASQGNLSMVLYGKRRRCKGFRWAYQDDFDAGHVAPERPPRNRGANAAQARPVRCVETGELFASSVLAGASKVCSPSHITSCCRGKRKSAGGFTWRYASSE